MKKLFMFLLMSFVAALLLASGAMAFTVSGATITGNGGAMGADGVVTLAPGSSNPYGYVSTSGGINGNVLSIGGTNGSTLRTSLFAANAGDELKFNFNYITSDGAGYADYAWARLLDASSNEVSLLFTARTTPGGNTVPGFGMPPITATVNPATVTVIPGGPTWSALGSSSGSCYSGGCGYTGWVESTYDVASAGSYYLEFGVANWLDTAYDSGLAFDGLTIAGNPINNNVPEPATMLLLGLALMGLAGVRRKINH